MKNYEKYKDKVNNCDGEYFCHDFVKPIILKADVCDGRCTRCRLIQAIWLMEEYEEPETDWNKVEVNTPILVRHDECDKWSYRYFAKYENGVVYAWHCGYPNWAKDYMVRWEYAKLAKSEDKCEKTSEEEPEVDWSKVAVDTPILVRDSKTGNWFKRYFAKFADGKVYAWFYGKTSWSSDNEPKEWKYAKLAEREDSDE